MIKKWLAMVVCCWAVSACTLPRFQPALPDVQSPQLTAESLITADGAQLPIRQWLPAGKPKAAIIALHGFNDYSNAFEMPANFLTKQGIAVYAYDQRGFGRTDHRGIWGGQQNMTQDVTDMLHAVRAKHPGTPLYLLGESMGGAVAVAALADKHFPQHELQGVILSAPALWGGNSLNPLHRFVLWTAAHQIPWVTLTGRGLKIMASDNIEMLKVLGRDPLIIKQTRIDAIYGLVQLMDNAQTHLPQVSLPVLLLYGKHDQVIPPKAIAAALKHPPKNLTVAMYDNGWHMLLRDLQAERVWRDVAGWVLQPSKPLPSGAEVYLPCCPNPKPVPIIAP